ncbi:MAG: hypothetical protein ACTHJU_02445 [Sphingopyxis sp.]
MSDEVEWIRSGKAQALLRSVGKGDFHLRQALRIGKVHARAAKAEVNKRGRYGGRDEFDDWDVPAEAWKGSMENSAFSLDGDYYSSGDYSISIGSVKLACLSFNKAEIVEHFEIEDTPLPAQATNKGKGGRGPKAEEWNNLIAALVVYAQSGPFMLDDQPGTTYRKALDYAASLGMGGEAISLDRCRDGILAAITLIRKAEHKDDDGHTP